MKVRYALVGALIAAASVAHADNAGKYVLEISIFERDTKTSPVSEWRQVGGVILPEYNSDPSNPLNAPVPFTNTTAGAVDLFPSDHLSIERLDVKDSAGNHVAYCNDLQLGMMAGWVQMHNGAKIPLQVIRTKDRSITTFAEIKGGGGGCDGFNDGL